MAREARARGLDAVIITSAFDTVRMAILEARRVNTVRKRERSKAEQLKAMLDFTHDCIIAIDKIGNITVFNKMAEKLTGWSAKKAMNRPVIEVIPNAGCHHLLKSGTPELGAIFEIGGVKVVGNRVPIIVDGKIDGVITTIQKLEVLQKIESKIRFKLSDKGLNARHSFENIIGKSNALTSTVALARDYATIDSTILIYGQTGTGKEIFAHAIHNGSKRRNEPFVAINCAALPESILESELFGYVEGAFTGASKGGKAGVFEMAHGGTLLLDEVGEMSPMLQSRFLRVIEQREIMRLGDSRILPVNVRLIAATHKNLREMVATGLFREDLYYRLNVLSLTVPALHKRGEDILEIAEIFLKEFYDLQSKPYSIFSDQSAKLLLEYDWPGNIRQLRNVMERLSVITSGGVIGVNEVKNALQIQEITPIVAVPGNPALFTHPAALSSVKITAAIAGGCSSGRLDDMKIIAEILAKNEVHPDVTFIITPGSRNIMESMDKLHISTVMRNGGAVIMPPGCGPCPGKHFGVLCDTDVAITTTVRNSPGRIGAKGAKIYLASPLTVALSAVNGRITEPQ